MTYITAGVIQSFTATLIFSAIVVSCWGTGLALCRKISDDFSAGEKNVLAIGAGLFLLGSMVWIAGMFGRLSHGVMTAIPVCMAFVAAVRLRNAVSGFKPAVLSGTGMLKWLPVLAAVAISWIGAVAPPSGTDALSYHLSHPKLFLENGVIDELPFTRESLWPYLTEMWFLIGLKLHGTALAKLFHWIFYPLGIAGIYFAGRRLYGEGAGYFGALFYCMTPVCFAQSTYAYVDLSLAFYTFWSFYLLYITLREPSKNYAVAAGIMAGAALSVKFLALGHIGVLLGFYCLFSGFNVLRSVQFLLAAAAAGGGWYIRSWIIKGNPVFPFFPQFFNGNGTVSDIAETGFGTGPDAFLGWLWNMTIHPAEFGGEMIGPWMLIFLPILLIRTDFKSRNSVFVMLYVTAYSLFLFTESQQVRFFLSIVPLLTLLCGYSACRLRSENNAFIRSAWISIVGCLCVLHLGIFVYRSKDAAEVLTGKVNAIQYLASKDRSFNGYMFLNRNTDPSDLIYNAAVAEHFYSDRRNLTFNNIFTRNDWEGRFDSYEAFLRYYSYDYIWLLKGSNPELESFMAKRGYRKVFSYVFHEFPAEYNFEIHRLIR